MPRSALAGRTGVEPQPTAAHDSPPPLGWDEVPETGDDELRELDTEFDAAQHQVRRLYGLDEQE